MMRVNHSGSMYHVSIMVMLPRMKCTRALMVDSPPVQAGIKRPHLHADPGACRIVPPHSRRVQSSHTRSLGFHLCSGFAQYSAGSRFSVWFGLAREESMAGKGADVLRGIGSCLPGAGPVRRQVEASLFGCRMEDPSSGFRAVRRTWRQPERIRCTAFSFRRRCCIRCLNHARPFRRKLGHSLVLEFLSHPIPFGVPQGGVILGGLRGLEECPITSNPRQRLDGCNLGLVSGSLPATIAPKGNRLGEPTPTRCDRLS